ncbi:MAG: hypothetical protein HQ510_07100 [Candidatus Marinimicrobia bacterium]|nr:hypothetical protein [Candidatus Neomarinimicrobiota bacterium]
MNNYDLLINSKNTDPKFIDKLCNLIKSTKVKHVAFSSPDTKDNYTSITCRFTNHKDAEYIEILVLSKYHKEIEHTAIAERPGD